MANPLTVVKLKGHDIPLPKEVCDNHLDGVDLSQPLDGKLDEETEMLVMDHRLLTVLLQNSEIMEVPVHILQRFNVVRALLEDINDITHDTPIPLCNVSRQCINYVLTLHIYDKDMDVYIKKAIEVFSDIDNLSEASRLTCEANFLDYPPLINAAAAVVGHRLNGVALQDIKKQFGITREFTDAERQAVFLEFPELSHDSDVSLNSMRVTCE
jgi:hypothetical protein